MPIPLLLIGVLQNLLDGVAIGAQNGATYALPARTVIVAWQTSYTGGPSAVNVILQVSLDGVVWTTYDTSTSTAGETRTITTPTAAKFIRAVIVSNTGGTLATVNIVCKVANP